ncbi:MAG: hypothetical protein ACE5H4_13630 [Candidatus Thorarchaeota archaeon]
MTSHDPYHHLRLRPVILSPTPPRPNRTDLFECPDCGHTSFYDGRFSSAWAEIDFDTKVVVLEPQVTFASDPKTEEGWFCVECGFRHPDSEGIRLLFEKWFDQDVFPYL